MKENKEQNKNQRKITEALQKPGPYTYIPRFFFATAIHVSYQNSTAKAEFDIIKETISVWSILKQGVYNMNP